MSYSQNLPSRLEELRASKEFRSNDTQPIHPEEDPTRLRRTIISMAVSWACAYFGRQHNAKVSRAEEPTVIPS